MMMNLQEVNLDNVENSRKRKGSDENVGDEIDPNVPLDNEPLLKPSTTSRYQNPGYWFHYVRENFWSAVFLVAGIIGLKEIHFMHEILYASTANHAFIHAGIFFASLAYCFGTYIEFYRSMFLGQKVTYETARSSTHGMLLSMVISGGCFVIGMWPIWGFLTFAYLFMWVWGVLLQIAVLFPVMIQRVIFVGMYLYFMHYYLEMFLYY